MASTSSSKWQKHVHDFDIDNYLNYIVPRPRFYLLPRPISHFFGYRPADAKPQTRPGNLAIWLSGGIGGFIGISIISAVYHALPVLGGQQVPIVIASFGAAAILEYNTIESPLSQPRNVVLGHALSAFIGVSITKAFQTLPPDRFDDLRWLAGAISVGLASFFMGVTKTIHPPAGATALLAATSIEITALGWWLIPLTLLASMLMLVSALIINNLMRRWPIFWWTAVDLSPKAPKNDLEHFADIDRNASEKPASVLTGSTKNTPHADIGFDAKFDRDSTTGSDTIVGQQTHSTAGGTDINNEPMVITRHKIVIPDWMEITDFERDVLESFRQRLQQRPELPEAQTE